MDSNQINTVENTHDIYIYGNNNIFGILKLHLYVKRGTLVP